MLHPRRRISSMIMMVLLQFAFNALAESSVSLQPPDTASVTDDDAAAFKMHKQAAEAGDATAMQLLGVDYSDGSGVSQDFSAARKWFEKSAAAGYKRALCDLGLMDEFGEGTTADQGVAADFYGLATKAGEFCGAQYLAKMLLAAPNDNSDNVRRAFDTIRNQATKDRDFDSYLIWFNYCWLSRTTPRECTDPSSFSVPQFLSIASTDPDRTARAFGGIVHYFTAPWGSPVSEQARLYDYFRMAIKTKDPVLRLRVDYLLVTFDKTFHSERDGSYTKDPCIDDLRLRGDNLRTTPVDRDDCPTSVKAVMMMQSNYLQDDAVTAAMSDIAETWAEFPKLESSFDGDSVVDLLQLAVIAQTSGMGDGLSPEYAGPLIERLQKYCEKAGLDHRKLSSKSSSEAFRNNEASYDAAKTCQKPWSYIKDTISIFANSLRTLQKARNSEDDGLNVDVGLFKSSAILLREHVLWTKRVPLTCSLLMRHSDAHEHLSTFFDRLGITLATQNHARRVAMQAHTAWNAFGKFGNAADAFDDPINQMVRECTNPQQNVDGRLMSRGWHPSWVNNSGEITGFIPMDEQRNKLLTFSCTRSRERTKNDTVLDPWLLKGGYFPFLALKDAQQCLPLQQR